MFISGGTGFILGLSSKSTSFTLRNCACCTFIPWSAGIYATEDVGNIESTKLSVDSVAKKSALKVNKVALMI